MKLKTILLGLLVALASMAVDAQTVMIVPKKTIHQRPRPEYDLKKTFSIRSPIAKASTSDLSQKITAAISPVKVLEINLKEEMGEFQWLEEADYKVLFNQQGVLCVELWMTGTAAYPDSVNKTVVVDIAKGMRVSVSDVLTDLDKLAPLVKKKQHAEVLAATKAMKKDPDADPKALFSETNFTTEDFSEFAVDAKGVTFIYDYGFPHVLEALQPSGKYHFTWAELKPFVRSDGLLARFVR
ncbi:MAG TPA: hypothetical protein VJV05_11145 [Pyrinomonadaceae bacterium]|nr:hypothetical protein [Pyrinomonadaceae bacterium]